MSSRTVIAITIGALLGLCLGGGGGVAIVRMRSQASVATVEAAWKPQPVTVASIALPVGTVVTADMLSTHPMPAAFINDALVTPEQAGALMGQRALMNVEAGEPLRWAYFEEAVPLPGLDVEYTACEAELTRRLAADESQRGLP